MPSRPAISMSRSEVDAFMRAAPHIGVLSTLARDGGPHAAGMYYAPEDDGLFMWTYAKSQKSKNLARDPRASLLVEAGEPYVDLKGVLIRGRAELITDTAEIARIGSLLYERYMQPTTGISLDDGARGPIEQQALKRIGVRLPLEKIASWDHAKAL